VQDGDTTPCRITGVTSHSELERWCVSENNPLFQRMKRCGILLVLGKKHWRTCDGKVSEYHGRFNYAELANSAQIRQSRPEYDLVLSHVAGDRLRVGWQKRRRNTRHEDGEVSLIQSRISSNIQRIHLPIVVYHQVYTDLKVFPPRSAADGEHTRSGWGACETYTPRITHSLYRHQNFDVTFPGHGKSCRFFGRGPQRISIGDPLSSSAWGNMRCSF